MNGIATHLVNANLSTAMVTPAGSVNSSSSTNDTSAWSVYLLRDICQTVLCTDNQNYQYYKLCKTLFTPIVDGIRIYSSQVSSASKVLLSVLLSLIMLASVCGNTLVVMTFVFNKHMRSVTNVFILSLAASDLMFAFTCVPLNMANELTVYWKFGRFACKLFAFISQFSMACSSLTLCCIAFDRYYAIVHPLKLKFLQAPRRATILQLIVLLISIASSLAYAFIFDFKKIPVCESVDDEEVNNEVCIATNSRTREIYERWITPILLLCSPFIFMSIMYGIICYNLWAQRPIGNRPQKATDNRIKLKRRAVKMLIMVVCIFGLCRSPVILFNAIADARHSATSMSNINWRAYLQCLSLSSACWNPIVYAFMNEKFRKAFKTLLRCRRGQVFPVMKRNNNLRMSAESRKTTTQLETPAIPMGSQQTSETRA